VYHPLYPFVLIFVMISQTISYSGFSSRNIRRYKHWAPSFIISIEPDHKQQYAKINSLPVTLGNPSPRPV
jgi:hypothetical protein